MPVQQSWHTAQTELARKKQESTACKANPLGSTEQLKWRLCSELNQMDLKSEARVIWEAGERNQRSHLCLSAEVILPFPSDTSGFQTSSGHISELCQIAGLQGRRSAKLPPPPTTKNHYFSLKNKQQPKHGMQNQPSKQPSRCPAAPALCEKCSALSCRGGFRSQLPNRIPQQEGTQPP